MARRGAAEEEWVTKKKVNMVMMVIMVIMMMRIKDNDGDDGDKIQKKYLFNG